MLRLFLNEFKRRFKRKSTKKNPGSRNSDKRLIEGKSTLKLWIDIRMNNIYKEGGRFASLRCPNSSIFVWNWSDQILEIDLPNQT